MCFRLNIFCRRCDLVSQLWQRGLKRATIQSDRDNVICGTGVTACLVWLQTLALRLVARATHVYSMLVAQNWHCRRGRLRASRSLLVVAVPTTVTHLIVFTACWERR